MTKITWLGEDALHNDPRGGPVSTIWRGITFPKNKPVEVADEATLAKAKNHPQFKVGGAEAKADKPEADALDSEAKPAAKAKK
jgi:hypothetical protein